MLSEYDFELLSKNRLHKCRADYGIYYSLSRGWEIFNSNNVVLKNVSHCPFCGENLG